MWQLWQALVLNNGPRPSRAVVVDGAITQGLRKKLLPTLKSTRRDGGRLAGWQGKRILIGLAHRRAAAGAGFTGFGLGELRGVIAGTQAQGQQQCRQAKRQRGHQTSCKTSKTRAQSLTGDGNLNKRNYRLLDVRAVSRLDAPQRSAGMLSRTGLCTRVLKHQNCRAGLPARPPASRRAGMKKATRRSPFSCSQR